MRMKKGSPKKMGGQKGPVKGPVGGPPGVLAQALAQGSSRAPKAARTSTAGYKKSAGV